MFKLFVVKIYVFRNIELFYLKSALVAMSSASSLSILEKSISYPGSTSSNTIIGRIVVQVSLARQGKDLVLGPECPKGGSRPPINGDDAAEARRFPVEVNITDHVGNVVAVST